MVNIKAVARWIKEDLVEGWEDMKLNALLQAILENRIDEDLLSNLVVLMKKEKKEALQKEPPLQVMIIDDAEKKTELPEMKSKEERILIKKKEHAFLTKFKKEKSPRKRGGNENQ